MTKTSTPLLTILIILLSSSMSFSQTMNRCSTDEFIAAKKQIDPDYDNLQQLWRTQMTPEYLEQYMLGNCATPTVLPIYFHFEDSYQTCIEDAMNDQLQILNEDYLGTNADISDFAAIASDFAANTLAADGACVQFCLVGSSYGQYGENSPSAMVF